MREEWCACQQKWNNDFSLQTISRIFSPRLISGVVNKLCWHLYLTVLENATTSLMLLGKMAPEFSTRLGSSRATTAAESDTGQGVPSVEMYVTCDTCNMEAFVRYRFPNG